VKEKTLLKLALSCGLIGLVLLYVIGEHTQLAETSIFELKHADSGKFRVQGTIEKITEAKGVTIVTISKQETLDIIFFKKVDFDEGNILDVTGELTNYNGEKEIVAKEG
jgi:DNA/RNA endonuclease YhcR with UshA esterase domain